MAALRSIVRRSLRADNGAELIEFALTLPLLLLVVLGIIEFGFMFHEYEVVTNAAREGARIAVLPAYSAADAQARAVQYLQASGLVAAQITPLPAVTGPTAVPIGGGKCVSTMTVNVSYSHPVPFISGIIQYFGGTFAAVTLHGTSTMRSEAVAGGC
jgi:Flp pilus assembly protein TadG